MITTLWRKHWMELRRIWAFNALFAILPAMAFTRLAEHHSGPVAPLVQNFIYLFAFFALGMFPVRFAGTGLATSKGFRAPRGADPSLLFTLSLPARRRTLFFYRTGFCLLAMESLAILGLVMAAVVFAQSGGSLRVFADGLWILLLMVPLYFLDSLLSIRFDAVTITQVQILGAGAFWFASPHLGVNPQSIAAVLSGIAPINFVLLTLFSIHGNDLNDIRAEPAIAAERSRKGELTWYISCDQVYPQPNYFIDAPAMDPVMVPWITWRYGLQGILYWDLKFWSQTVDPWLNPTTYLSGYLCSNGRNLNGEGSLLYPGSEVHRYTGQKDVDGPVSSIRFELLREGIEDYEYLWMLKSLGDPAFADEVVHSMVATVGAFSRDPDQLYAARQKMARRIEQLTRRR